MSKTVRDLIRRMGFVGGLLLTMVFAVPAFESHACADELSPAVAEATLDAAGDSDLQCPDCGPGCAGGCCHAPHAATAPDGAASPGATAFAAPPSWRHLTGRPLEIPGGPDRPPRS